MTNLLDFFQNRNRLFPGRLIMLAFLSILISSCDKCKDDIAIDPPAPPPLQLDYMEVEEIEDGGVLYLYGNFGDSTATSAVWLNNVEINGSSVIQVLISWKPYLIKCSIPGANLEGGAGKVWVSNQGISSNTRTLNRWKGLITFHRPDQGTLERTMWITAYLRADADPHKNIPYLFSPRSGFASASRLNYTIGGQGSSTYSNDGCMVTMTANLTSANGTLKPKFPFQYRTEEEYFQSALRFLNGQFEVTDIDVFKKGISTLNMDIQSCGTPSQYSLPRDLYGLPYELQTFNMTFEPNSKVIQSGQILHKASTEMGLVWDSGQVPQYTCQISWERMVPEF